MLFSDRNTQQVSKKATNAKNKLLKINALHVLISPLKIVQKGKRI